MITFFCCCCCCCFVIHFLHLFSLFVVLFIRLFAFSLSSLCFRFVFFSLFKHVKSFWPLFANFQSRNRNIKVLQRVPHIKQQKLHFMQTHQKLRRLFLHSPNSNTVPALARFMLDEHRTQCALCEKKTNPQLNWKISIFMSIIHQPYAYFKSTDFNTDQHKSFCTREKRFLILWPSGAVNMRFWKADMVLYLDERFGSHLICEIRCT